MSEEQKAVEEKEITTSDQVVAELEETEPVKPKQKSVIDVLGKKEFELDQMIINAKKEAEEIVKSAKKKAGDIVVQARKVREEIFRVEARLSGDELKEKIEAEKVKVALEAKKEKEEEVKTSKELKEKYSKNMDKAVERFVEVVVAGN